VTEEIWSAGETRRHCDWRYVTLRSVRSVYGQ